jgi:hypothetical protein
MALCFRQTKEGQDSRRVILGANWGLEKEKRDRDRDWGLGIARSFGVWGFEV